MTIIELKEQILDKSLSDQVLILQYSDTDFICNQYIKEIASFKGLETRSIASLKEVNQNSFSALNSVLSILRVDDLKENADFDNITNVIIVCKSIDKTLKAKIEDFIITIPKLIDWQIMDYMKVLAPGLDEPILTWIYKMTNGDIYRIANELTKIGMFDSEYQATMFNLLNSDNAYNDLTTETIFNYLTAIIKKDKGSVYRILKEGEAVDLEGTGLATLLIRQLKNLIMIQIDPTTTAESLGMKVNQFKAIKYNCGIYSNDQLIDLFEFITSLDYRLKSGNLEFTNRQLVDYITCKFLSI